MFGIPTSIIIILIFVLFFAFLNFIDKGRMD